MTSIVKKICPKKQNNDYPRQYLLAKEIRQKLIEEKESNKEVERRRHADHPILNDRKSGERLLLIFQEMSN